MNIIFTNNALRKLRNSGVEKWQAEKAFKEPQRTNNSRISGCTDYVRVNNHIEIGVIAKQEDKDTWIIVSAWKRKLLK